MNNLDAPLREAVGAATAKALAVNFDLDTVGDLLYYLPRKYEKRGEHTDLRSLDIGADVTVLGQVTDIFSRAFAPRGGPRKGKRSTLLEVVVGDGSGGRITLTYFNQSWREKELRRGQWGLFAGKVTAFRGKLQLNSPEMLLFEPAEDDGEHQVEQQLNEFTEELIPVYPANSKMASWKIAQCVRKVLDMVQLTDDPAPARIRAERSLADLPTALREIHRPSSRQLLAAARQRLAWDEAFAVQLTLVRRKREAAAWPAAPRPRTPGGLLDDFDASLPFTLTEGQLAVGEEISDDLGSPHPMHRLLQGEVGAGKTLVALRAMLQVADAGGQAALLAPTEVLAAQHFRGITKLLGPAGSHLVTLITGSQAAAARRRTLNDLASGAASLIVGTHALLYEGVEFRDLGLVVVDEQHRFGVEQRDALRAKAEQPPHVLVMTATPIPRTVAMTVYGDLDVSTLAQLPGGRLPIATHVVPAADKPAFLDRAWQRLVEEVQQGHQAYVVCPRIGDGAAASSDEEAVVDADDDARAPLAVLEIAPLLEQGPLAGLRLGVLHGRLPADEKDAVMRAFAAGQLDVLVATTVIEVGVDVPNATLMMILDADRFGMSQLHQLRGRVGRGQAAGLCLLVTETPGGTPARARLDAVASTTDGFRLAELDLAQRREGDVLGASQSGRRSHLRLLSLLRDKALITQARAKAEALLAADPSLAEHPLLAAAVAQLVAEDRAEYLEKG